MTLGDRLLVLHEGRASQLGTPMAIFERPADVYVAGFIGSPAMNFLDGAIAADGAVELAVGLTVPVDIPSGTEGQLVVLGIRPEHLTVAPSGLVMIVDLVEPMGSETLVHGHVAAAGEQTLTVKLTSGGSVSDRMTVRPDAGQVHVFDRATGKRLGGR